MRIALPATVIALAIPATAMASTAQVVEDPRAGASVSYHSAAGEANDLSVQGTGASVVLTDPGAAIVPGDGCAPSGAHSVTCTTGGGFGRVDATLGDEEDRFTSDGLYFGVDGGPGDDTLEGGEAGGEFVGGDGDDVLEGGKLASTFIGGEGADEMTGTDQFDLFMGGPGPDSIDGRGQVTAWELGDTVSYRDHTAPVTIDLSKPGSAAGAAGEGDTVSNVENAYGGAGSDTITAPQALTSTNIGSRIVGFGGDDVIRGGPRRDDLHGGKGDDWVRGAGANDTVGGEEGHDRLAGGAGFNSMISWDGATPERDSVRCGDRGSVSFGPGTVALLDVIGQSCRRVELPYWPITKVEHRYPGRPARAVRVTTGCHTYRCVVRIALRAHRTLVGSAEREIKPGARGTLTAPLSREAREELARTGVLKLRFSLVVRFGKELSQRNATSYYLLLHDPPAAR